VARAAARRRTCRRLGADGYVHGADDEQAPVIVAAGSPRNVATNALLGSVRRPASNEPSDHELEAPTASLIAKYVELQST